jgi:hypothetical protein
MVSYIQPISLAQTLRIDFFGWIENAIGQKISVFAAAYFLTEKLAPTNLGSVAVHRLTPSCSA